MAENDRDVGGVLRTIRLLRAIVAAMFDVIMNIIAGIDAAQLKQFASDLVGLVWDTPLFLLLLGCGLLFSVFSKVVQWRILRHGYSCIRGHYDNPDDVGHINHFQALCAALSATIGLGNIAGVAVAVTVGGPGAVFWMWVVGFFGMALKFMECTLAVMYRDERDVPDPSAPALMEADAEAHTLEYAGGTPSEQRGRPRARGEVRGGPMWYMQKALVDPLKRRGNVLWVPFKILAVCFAIATVLNSFGSGNMYQGWNVADMLSQNFGVPVYVSAVVVSMLVAMVIIGGIKRIGQVASMLVPFMCVVYVGGALVVILLHVGEIPRCLGIIVESAFTPVAETGACAGVTVWMAFQWGLKRACFSNEAGEGSAAMAHAAAKTDEPIREGVVAGMGPFIDTIIICTMSALVLLMTDAWNRPAVGTVAAVEGDSVLVVCTPEIPRQLERQYLEMVAPAEGRKLSLHVVRQQGEEPKTLTPVIAAVSTVEGEGWARMKSLTLDLSSLRDSDTKEFSDETKANVEKIEVGQPVHLDITGAKLTAFAFDTTINGFGKYMLTFGVCLFAFSTMVSWSYYGEKGAEYLLGPQAILPYKFLFVIFVFCGMILDKFETVYDLSDATAGMMVLCNLPAVLILSPVVLRAAKSYFSRLDKGDMPKLR